VVLWESARGGGSRFIGRWKEVGAATPAHPVVPTKNEGQP
jgi:hypothetical protein